MVLPPKRSKADQEALEYKAREITALRALVAELEAAPPIVLSQTSDGEVHRLTALRSVADAARVALATLDALIKAEVDSIPGAKDIIYDPVREDLRDALATLDKDTEVGA